MMPGALVAAFGAERSPSNDTPPWPGNWTAAASIAGSFGEIVTPLPPPAGEAVRVALATGVPARVAVAAAGTVALAARVAVAMAVAAPDAVA